MSSQSLLVPAPSEYPQTDPHTPTGRNALFNMGLWPSRSAQKATVARESISGIRGHGAAAMPLLPYPLLHHLSLCAVLGKKGWFRTPHQFPARCGCAPRFCPCSTVVKHTCMQACKSTQRSSTSVEELRGKALKCGD